MPSGIRSDLEQSRLCTAIGIVFGFEERWLEFFYSHKIGELRASPQDLLTEARCFSRGEQIMIKVALDFWTDGHHASVSEMINSLDWESLSRVLLAIMTIRDVTAQDIIEIGSRYEG